MTKNKLALCMIPLLAGSLTACNDEELTSDTSQYVPYSLEKVIYPNDLLISKADGTLDLPVESTGEEVDYHSYENVYGALDGWSTGYPIVLPISGPGVELDTATLTDNTYILNTETGKLLVPHEDYFVEVTESGDIQILQKKVLPESTPYIIALSDGITDIAGTPLKRSNNYQRLLDGNDLDHAMGEDAINQLQSNHGELAAAGVQGEIVYSARFTTQSIYPVMDAAIRKIPDQALSNVVPEGKNEADDEVWTYKGTIKIPYYLEMPNSLNCEVPSLYPENSEEYRAIEADKIERCEPLYSWWKDGGDQFVHGGNPEPIAQSEQVIPVMIYAPKGWKPYTPTGFTEKLPATIFVHGITGWKESAQTMAKSITETDRLVIAIDQPLHGERGVDLDGVPPMEITATSTEDKEDKSVYLNLLSPLTLRDNQRQAVVDQLALRKALNNTGFVDSADISLIGHSLGGIISTMVSDLSQNKPGLGFSTVTLVVPGMHLTDLVMNSPLLGGDVAREIKKSSDIQLAVAGMVGVYDEETDTKVEGLNALFAFKLESEENRQQVRDLENMLYDMVSAEMFPAVQAAVDAGDPANFIQRQAENKEQPILLIEAAGTCTPESCEEGKDYLPDNVVVNSVADKPLAGTEPLIEHLGLTPISPRILNGVDNGVIRGTIRVMHGGHGTYLFPYEGPVTFKDKMYPEGRPMTIGDPGFVLKHIDEVGASLMMQQKAITSFVTSQGTEVIVDDTSPVH